MIKTKGLKTNVFFGSTQSANIAVGSDYGILTLQELSTEGIKIGDKLQDKDVKELPKIIMHFYLTSSIDVVIAHLESIKRNMENGGLPLAC